MTKIDAVKAFHAVPITQHDYQFYTFLTENGPYCYKVLPMGTRNSPTLFAEYVTKILQDVREKYPDCIKNYQDDIMIAAPSIEETTKITKLVIAKMKEAGLQTNILKSYLDPLSPKPLLGAVWNPKNLQQANEATTKLFTLWTNWKTERSLRSYRRFTGKLASLSNFPGYCAKIQQLVNDKQPEADIERILKQATQAPQDRWQNE
eukprot:GHVP01009032.1.p1 GENE.GHVP01009032.1~~GHVP01009032.1.p1  ORF type:complete len:205 (-),score=23.33 GHVP01009032.1:277-891(-)